MDTSKTFVGRYANCHIGTDCEPYEIIAETPSRKTLTIRPMKAELDKTWKPEFIVGGFAGHCVNQGEQRWIITPIEDAETQKIRLGKGRYSPRKGSVGFYSKGGLYFNISDHPSKYYDYNF